MEWSVTPPPSFDQTVMEVTDDGAVRLLASRCPACQAVMLPPRCECARCGATTVAAEVPGEGEVTAVVVSMLPVAGAEPPVTVAEVTLLAELVVQGVVNSPVAAGDVVRLVARPVSLGDIDVTAFAFEAVDG